MSHMEMTKECPHCAGEILAEATKCKHCKEFIKDALAASKTNKQSPPEAMVKEQSPKNFAPVIGRIHRKTSGKIGEHPFKPLLMFISMNAAIFISVAIVSLGNVRFAFLAMAIGMIGPFLTLFLSKVMAKWTMDLREIKPGAFSNKSEQQLYHLVKTLSSKAGIEVMPEVTVYESPDMNAFATGCGRNKSLVAFSSALLDKMNEEEVAAVAAHEIAHIANGDMLSMTIMQSAINMIVILINIGVKIMMDDHKDGIFAIIAKTVVRYLIVLFAMFLGNLLLLWFSRHREFKADALAAKLVEADAMISALSTLKQDAGLEIPEEVAEQQEAYAALKISSKDAALDILCTHPSLDRRIESLKTIQ